MRILLADKLSPSCIRQFEADGHFVANEPHLSGEALAEAMKASDPNVLIVRSTKVPEEAMEAGKALELIVRAGAGYDTIDVAAASDRGIFVANCPGKNSAAVAELTMALILSLDRSVPDNVMDARAGVWNKARYGKATGVKDRILGVVGMGNIGKEVVKRAHAFEMRVVAWSRSLTIESAEALGVEKLNSPLEVAAFADYVTLHVASTPETRILADAKFFDAMKPGSFFVNTTRAAVVDEEALTKAMASKGIRAALDVFSDEPAVKEGPFSHPLARHKGVYLTHHIGASTLQAQEAIAQEAARVVLAYASTGTAPNCVNMAMKTAATHKLAVRHRDRIGVLASVLDIVRKAGWNVQEMENVVFAGERAACAYLRIDGSDDESVLQAMRANPDVLAVTINRL